VAIQCQSCGQSNPDEAQLCEFCKALFHAPAPRPRPPVAPSVPVPVSAPASGRWSTPLVALIAVVCLGVGLAFGLRRVPAAVAAPVLAPPPVVVATLPVPAPAEAPPDPEAPSLAAEPVPAGREQAPIPVRPEPPPPPPPALVATPAAPPKHKVISVPYQPFEGSARRIIISVTFNDKVTAPMALDTGAPGTLISSQLAERLGVLEANEGRLVTLAGGIGGQKLAVLVVLDSIAVDEARTDFVLATVVEPMSAAFEGLVGMDFLAGYAVEIDTKQHLLTLTEQDQSDEQPGGHDERWWRESFAHLGGQRAIWEQTHLRLEEGLKRSRAPSGLTLDQATAFSRFADTQSREAQLLFDRLERQASRHSVPREWRVP
jgi:predicted aspartyl protease